MKQLFTLFAIFVLGVGICGAYNFPDEQLHYKVMYKWGLINKQAGTVTITLHNTPESYNARLTAASASWADKIFKVRDTLTCRVTKEGFRPQVYEKMSHEGSDDKHDKVVYIYEGDKVIGKCTRFEKSNGKVKKDEERTLEAQGTTVDMLSAFYYMRNLPYDNWNAGHNEVVNIYSGKRKELLTIKYHGMENVSLDGKNIECYKITFIFTSDGKKKTSDDMYAWIRTADRIPIKLEGKLPIGSVRCFYTDN